MIHAFTARNLYSDLLCCRLQSNSLADNQTLTTMLPGQDLTVYVKGPGRIVISGVQTAANVTQADIRADKVRFLASTLLCSSFWVSCPLSCCSLW